MPAFLRAPTSPRRVRPTSAAVRAFQPAAPVASQEPPVPAPFPGAIQAPQLRPHPTTRRTVVHRLGMPALARMPYRPWSHAELTSLDQTVSSHPYLTAIPGFIPAITPEAAQAVCDASGGPGWDTGSMSPFLGTRGLFHQRNAYVSDGVWSYPQGLIQPIYPLAQEITERACSGLTSTEPGYMPVYRYGDGLIGRLHGTRPHPPTGATQVLVDHFQEGFIPHYLENLCVSPVDRQTPLAVGDLVVIPRPVLADYCSTQNYDRIGSLHDTHVFALVTGLDGDAPDHLTIRFHRTFNQQALRLSVPWTKVLLPTWETVVKEATQYGSLIRTTLTAHANGNHHCFSAPPGEAEGTSFRASTPAPAPAPAPTNSWRTYHSHGWKPAVRLIGGPSSPRAHHRRAGIELEIELDRDSVRRTIGGRSDDRDALTRKCFEVVDEAILRAGGTPPTRDAEELFHGESDGSLTFGCEFPTAAFSIDPLTAWRDPAVICARAGIQALVNFLEPLANEDECKVNCGLHVHLTRRAFSPSDSDNAKRYYLALALAGHLLVRGMTTSKNRWARLTRREGTSNPGDPSYAHTSGRGSGMLDDIATRGRFQLGDRYSVFNLTNQHTVEFRSCGNPWDDTNWHNTAVEIADSLDSFLYAIAATPGMIGHAWLEVIRTDPDARRRYTANHVDLPPPGRFWTMWRDFASLHEPMWSNAVDALDSALDDFPIT